MSKFDFSAEEFADRLETVRGALAAAKLDWIVLFHPVSILWLTGSEAKSYQSFQCLLVSAQNDPLTLVVRDSERAEILADTLVEDLVTWGGSEPEDPLDVFNQAIGSRGLKTKRVGIEVPAYYLHPHHYIGVKAALGPALVAEPSNFVHDLKLVKSPAEIAYIRTAAKIAGTAMAAFRENLSVGRSELEIAGEVYRTLMAAGSGLPASTLNLVSGERCAFSHGAPTERRLKSGDFGNIEYGAAYRRYTSTIGRQFMLGRPTPRMQEIFDLARYAADECIAKIRDGVPAVVPHEAAKRVIAEAGLDRYRIHTTGYGLAPGFPPSWGEPINMFGGSDYTLRAGMVITVEPPIFVGEEAIGARLIDNVLVTKDGAELLSTYPRDLLIIE